ncbi:hypothetical protein KJ758_03865 [Patescibacteria group bacterium]|nr:hypothetical protein [Patescibacteria group bacterium]
MTNALLVGTPSDSSDVNNLDFNRAPYECKFCGETTMIAKLVFEQAHARADGVTIMCRGCYDKIKEGVDIETISFEQIIKP